MISEILPEYDAAALGAPFGIILVTSARRDGDGSITLPDLPELVAVSGMTRLWRDERLSGDELRHLRRSAEMAREDLGRGMGASEEDVRSYEEGPRAMALGTEKYVRVHLFNALRRVNGPRTDLIVNYLDWIFDEWKPCLREATSAIEIRLKHFPTGWQEVPVR